MPVPRSSLRTSLAFNTRTSRSGTAAVVRVSRWQALKGGLTGGWTTLFHFIEDEILANILAPSALNNLRISPLGRDETNCSPYG